MLPNMTKTLLQNSIRAAVKLGGLSLLALSLAFQAPAVAAEHGHKSPVKAKHAVKKSKIAGAKAIKAKVKLAKLKHSVKKPLKQLHAKKAVAAKPGSLAAKRAAKQKMASLKAPIHVLSKADAPKPNTPTNVAVVRPAIARQERAIAMPAAESAAVTTTTDQAILPPEFRIATAACQRDGKVYLLAGCNSAELPEVLTANTTKIDAR